MTFKLTGASKSEYNPVFEFCPLNNFTQLLESVQSVPPFLVALAQLEYHAQHAVSIQTPLEASSPMLYRLAKVDSIGLVARVLYY